MSDTACVSEYRIVFGCLTCGTLLSLDNIWETSAECGNCHAGYHALSQPQIARYYAGNPPSRWESRGHEPVKESDA